MQEKSALFPRRQKSLFPPAPTAAEAGRWSLNAVLGEWDGVGVGQGAVPLVFMMLTKTDIACRGGGGRGAWEMGWGAKGLTVN